MSIITYKVKPEGNESKVRDYLKYEENLSSRFIKNAAMDKRLWVNNEKVKLNYVLKEGDIIKVDVEKDETQNIEGEDLNIEVVHEDEDLLVVNKPPFMVVHPTKRHQSGTLANGIIYHFRKNNDSSIVRLVSRLDRDTSGLIMIAKNQFAHMTLAKSMENNLIEKKYLAIVHGIIEKDSGTIDAAIGRPSDDSIKRAVMENGQRSITHYNVIKRFNNATLVELKLETGRTHQIRVHLSSIGHPIYGDSLYGKQEPQYIKRQALHAYKLILPHPRSNDFLEIKSQIPQDMEVLIEILKKEH